MLDGRTDVLPFTSEVLAEDVEVTGHVTVTLSASTSVTDTDFTAKLIDVWPDGRAMGVVAGKRRRASRPRARANCESALVNLTNEILLPELA